MKKSIECSPGTCRTCSLCNKSTAAEGIATVYFGDWMVKNNIVAHYYCLLLATNLPQRGEDHNGILGFLLRDIRIEISRAKKRKCIYCLEMSATIECSKCKKYFHLTCGHTSKSLSQFVGEFKSYCNACVPIDQYQMKLFARKEPKITEFCFICSRIMGSSPKSWIYAKCCGSGYTHSQCMKIYALSAGYYLSCIWCKDKRFREDIKYLGIFVPDRDANWEREKGAYGDLYRRHRRCDMEICNCPKGRDYTKAPKWQLVICKLCGASGAHSNGCIPGFAGSKEKTLEYKCDVCSVTEQTIQRHKSDFEPMQGLIDKTLYVHKDEISDAVGAISPSPSSESNSRVDTSLQKDVISATVLSTSSPVMKTSKPDNASENMKLSSTIYALTQSPQTSQQHLDPWVKTSQDENSDSDDGIIVDLLVQKMLNIFE